MPDQPRKDNPARTVRVERELWEAAKARADDRGETVSDAVRAFLRRYSRPIVVEACKQCGKPNPGNWCDGCGWQK